ncbi:MAG: 4-(cytidine 5'-diphospho)-2-C-methyl-D-erythritol kinase [Ignavibacteriae bacterium]|nr:4-(cytidine 5'-diphospho)-2-C-methyl-D-erythritol kinase [Ignavibacteriota bacterium]
MKKLILNSPAKINFGLNIINKRNDGFHNLQTFFYPIYDLCDKITFEHSNNFIFDSNNIDLVKDSSNLIQRAVSSIEELIKRKLNVKIYLEKIIPIGAGLGGGSSNAASTLMGLNEMFELKISDEKLHQIALELGSDVPFFINSKPAVGSSRGEILEISQNYIDKVILIINPKIHISTKDAFSNIQPKPSNFDYNYFLNSEEIDFNFLRNNLINDFENYVFNKYSEIKNIKNEMYNNGAVFSLMSGTGSTVYGVFENIEQAKIVYNLFPKEYFKFISSL